MAQKNMEHFLKVLVLALLAAGGTAACQSSEDPPIIAAELLENEADNVSYSVTHYMTREGVREAILEADTAFAWQDSTAISLRNLTLTVYDDVGRAKAVVTADAGRLDPESRSMFAQGNVVLTIPENGRIVESEELNYDPDADRIWSDMPTVSRERGRVIEGSGFDADTQLSNIRIRNARTRGGVRF